MVQTAESSGLTIVSGPYQARKGRLPLMVGLIIGFGFSILWLTVSVFLILDGHLSNVVWGVMTALCTLLYCAYMGYVGYGMIVDSKKQYVLELTNTEVVLTVRDKLRRRKATQMVLLDDVKYAEYYPYQDSSLVILHAPYTVMEIPLWPMGNQSQDVMDFLSGRGIPVMNVQFDDQIPE